MTATKSLACLLLTFAIGCATSATAPEKSEQQDCSGGNCEEEFDVAEGVLYLPGCGTEAIKKLVSAQKATLTEQATIATSCSEGHLVECKWTKNPVAEARAEYAVFGDTTDCAEQDAFCCVPGEDGYCSNTRESQTHEVAAGATAPFCYCSGSEGCEGGGESASRCARSAATAPAGVQPGQWYSETCEPGTECRLSGAEAICAAKPE